MEARLAALEKRLHSDIRELRKENSALDDDLRIVEIKLAKLTGWVMAAAAGGGAASNVAVEWFKAAGG